MRSGTSVVMKSLSIAFAGCAALALAGCFGGGKADTPTTSYADCSGLADAAARLACYDAAATGGDANEAENEEEGKEE